MPPNETTYAAARTVFDRGLGADSSIFLPTSRIWTAVTAEDLYERFVLAPDTSGASFVEKLQVQLDGAEPTTVVLAAELLYLHFLAPDDIRGPTKQRVIRGTLDLVGSPVEIPPELAPALDTGFARVGTAFLTQRDRQLAFLVEFVRAWKKLPEDARATALVDPWAFREVVDGIPRHGAHSQRNALLHLAFPRTFEPIVSRSHKAAILDAFAGDLPGGRTGDEDRDLLALRTELERREGGPISYYRSELEQRWRPKARADEPAPTVRGWLVRGANVHGHDLVPQWLTEGFCSIAYPEVPELRQGLTRSEIDARLAEAMPDLSVRQRAIHIGVLDRFLNQIHPGDLVTTVDGPDLYVGTITSEPIWHESPLGLSNRRRAVNWLPHDPPLRRDQLSDGARDKLSGQMTVSDLGAGVTEFATLADFYGADAPDRQLDDEPDPDPAEPVYLPAPTSALADELLIDVDWLTETVDLLREKKQLVLYGPPGTGKTYLAQELARYFAEETGGAYRLVQFHPSYAYEDFFEGFRPQPGETSGSIAFTLEPGPFKLLVNDALDDISRAYVLVIDEINRANLAKVFGELYFLLEYRDRSVSLQYSPADEFRLPPNVFVIGTMNTADRSIALVDAAMRRRFAWQALLPGEPPVSAMLRRWLSREGLPADRADLLDTLNGRIGHHDRMIGPSYLMTRGVATEDGLRKIWKHHVMPVLEEYHVGEGVDLVGTYGLDALRRSRAAPAATGGAAPEELPEESGELAG